MVRLYGNLMFRSVGPNCCGLMMFVVGMFFVVVELLFEDFGQQPGQLLGVVVLVAILVEKAEEERVRGGNDDQEWDEELHVVLISVAVVFLSDYW